LRVHLIETVGEGGIYQHTVAVAQILDESGVQVTLHTAADREIEPPAGVEVCDCVKWFRQTPRGLRRKLLIAFSYAFYTTPHLVWRVKRGQVAHYQAHLMRPVTAALMWLLRLRGARVVHSPHNTFVRWYIPLAERTLRLCSRAAVKSIVFSAHDADVIREWGGDPVAAPLVQYLPEVAPERVDQWRKLWRANGDPVVLFAGQMREDKCLDVLIDAVRRSGRARLAVVGGTEADAAPYRQLADDCGLPVSWSFGFHPLEEFAAAITAADVVVCPYRQASQSGVLSVARQLGTATVSSDVGGLAELADRSVPVGDSDALATAIEEVIATAGDRRAMAYWEETRAAHLTAYGLSLNGNGRQT
jgi:glycosyltransferase involved in cell wall biosynthesis